ncbi:MAG: carbon-nitrogen hydrolase family protein [Bacteroidota bacterium]
MPEIAIVQASPVYNDIGASLDKALTYISKLAGDGVQLIVFGECWLSGYPAWIDYGLNVAHWDHEPVKLAYQKIFENSISLESSEIQQLQAAARENEVCIVIGVNEVILEGRGNGTIFNSLLTINNEGEIANLHRKLMPTFNEKLIYGLGDGAGLKVVETPIGKLGGLICWEHWMPLTRQAMHDAAEDIHVAVWPSVKEMHQVASRHYAFEGRCYVMAAGLNMRVSDIPEGIKLPESLSANPDQLILNGGSCIIGPDGKFIVEPVFGETEIIRAKIPDTSELKKEKMSLSVSGHYQRPDVFGLTINKKRYF